MPPHGRYSALPSDSKAFKIKGESYDSLKQQIASRSFTETDLNVGLMLLKQAVDEELGHGLPDPSSGAASKGKNAPGKG